MKIVLRYLLSLWVFLLSSSFSYSATVCPTNTVGLCDPSVIEKIITDTVTETFNEPNGITEITTTTETTTVTTVTNENSGDLLNESNGYTNHGGDQESDVGGKGSATQTYACRTLGTSDKCSGLTSSSLTTYEWNNLDVSGLSMEGRGGRVTYSVAIDVPNSDTTSITITGVNASGETVLNGTDALSVVGSTTTGIFEGGFDFSDNLSRISIKMFGTNYSLTSQFPVFDDLSATVYWNVVSTIVTQTITTIEQFIAINTGADDTVIDIAEDIFDNNEFDENTETGELIITPIDEGNTDNELNYETVELELENFDVDIEVNFEPIDVSVEATPEIEIQNIETEIEQQLDVDLAPKPEVAEEPATSESEPEPETVAKVEAKETESEPKKQEVKKKETPKVVVKKKVSKQEAGSKIVKKMSDKQRYDSTSQLKTLVIMNVISDSKSFFENQLTIPDTDGFFSTAKLPDTKISDNNYASLILFGSSSIKMEQMISSQYDER